MARPRFAAAKGRRSVVGSEGIRIEVTAAGKTTERQLIWVFPEMAGVIAERLDGMGAQLVDAHPNGRSAAAAH